MRAYLLAMRGAALAAGRRIDGVPVDLLCAVISDHGEALSSSESASGEHFATALGCHACAKTVYAQAASDLRLIRSLWHCANLITSAPVDRRARITARESPRIIRPGAKHGSHGGGCIEVWVLFTLSKHGHDSRELLWSSSPPRYRCKHSRSLHNTPGLHTYAARKKRCPTCHLCRTKQPAWSCVVVDKLNAQTLQPLGESNAVDAGGLLGRTSSASRVGLSGQWSRCGEGQSARCAS